MVLAFGIVAHVCCPPLAPIAVSAAIIIRTTSPLVDSHIPTIFTFHRLDHSFFLV